MKKYLVTLALIVGYYDSECDSPKLIYSQYEVEAKDEITAIYTAKNIDKTRFSVWESWAEEL